MFNSKILSISMIIVETSSIFIFEISTGFFVHFFDYVDFIVYAFEMIMTFSLFAELISIKMIKGVLSKYKVWESYFFVITFKATLLIRSQLRLKTLC